MSKFHLHRGKGFNILMPKGKVTPLPAKRVRKIVNRQINRQTEKFYAEGIVSPSAVSSTVTVQAIGMPTQGNAYNQRKGDEITFTSIKGRVQSTCSDATNIVRFMIIQWMPDNLVDAPTAAKLFESPVTIPWLSQPVQNGNARAKFRVLYDTIMNLSFEGGAQAIRTFNVYRSKMAKARFGTGLSTGRGLLYYVTVSDSSAVTHPNFASEFIYKWMDK